MTKGRGYCKLLGAAFAAMLVDGAQQTDAKQSVARASAMHLHTGKMVCCARASGSLAAWHGTVVLAPVACTTARACERALSMLLV